MMVCIWKKFHSMIWGMRGEDQMEFSQNLGHFLRNQMRQQGLTISELAENTTISRSAMQSYLSGDSNPRLDTIELLCQIWNVNPNVLLCGEPDQTKFSHDALIQQCFQLPPPIQTYVMELLQTIEHLVSLLAAANPSDTMQYITQVQELTNQEPQTFSSRST